MRLRGSRSFVESSARPMLRPLFEANPPMMRKQALSPSRAGVCYFRATALHNAARLKHCYGWLKLRTDFLASSTFDVAG